MTLPGGYSVEREVALPLGDGVVLRADVYRPDGDGPHPVMLMRTPYGKASAQQDVYAHPGYFARRGAIVVVQDMRGCGTSDGVFEPFRDEARDGAATVAWCATLPGSSGAVFMYGYSYAGCAALLAASERPSGLAGILPAMASARAGEGWTLRDGIVRAGFTHGWATQLAALAASRAGDAGAASRITQMRARGPRPGMFAEASESDLATFAPYFRDWLLHQDDADYWERLTPAAALSDIDVPVLLVAGWHDEFLRGTLLTYRELAAREAAPPVSLHVGPWCHSPWSRYTGALDFGPAGEPAVDELMVDWIDTVLDGSVTPTVRYFAMGADEWRDAATWPPAPQGLALALASRGRAKGASGDGRLGTAPGGEPDHLWVDPEAPVRMPRGGDDPASLTRWGPIDHARVTNRRDVLCYTGDALAAPLELAGEVRLRAFLTPDCEAGELHATVLDVHPDGRSYPVSRGVARFHPRGRLGGAARGRRRARRHLRRPRRRAPHPTRALGHLAPGPPAGAAPRRRTRRVDGRRLRPRHPPHPP